jgi:hypothetical protein
MSIWDQHLHILNEFWLVVSTPLKKISQIGSSSQRLKTIQMFQTTNQMEKWLEPLGPASTDPIHHSLASSIWEWPHGPKEGLLGPHQK